MRSWFWRVGFLVLMSAWIGHTALAGETDQHELVNKLKSSPDFRVRTQAALALGAGGNKGSVDPLCTALTDANTTVRAAAAAALGRLALGGKPCIEKSLLSERSEEVKTVLRRALTRLAPPAPTIGSQVKYYVAFGDVTNQTQRSAPELNQIVRAALGKHIASISMFALAPEGETAEQATKLLAKHPGVTGLYVWPKITTTYAHSSLVLKVELSLFSYPGKVFKGTFSKNLTMPDVPTRDTAAEDELMEMAAERLAPDLERNAGRL